MISAVPYTQRDENLWSTVMLKINGLETLQIPSHENAPAIVLLHGYGADANDLFPLASFLKDAKNFHWYLPHAPMTIPTSPFTTGRAWFPIEDRDFDLFMSGKTAGFTAKAKELFNKAAKMVDGLIEQITPLHSQVIIGGFSQGAMISCEVAFGRKNIHKLLVLSGILVLEESWSRANKKDLQVFQCHGTQDPILPFAGAIRLKDLFEKKNFKHTFVQFDGGHEIPSMVCKELASFLEDLK